MQETLAETSGPRDARFTAAGVASGMRRLLTLSVLLVVPFGMAFGAAAIERGLTTFEAVMMSTAVFAGASQFATLEVWREPLPLLSIGLVVLAVNARLIIMGAALSPWINPLPRRDRLLAVIALSDANFADSYAALRGGARDAGIILGGGLIMWAFWVMSTWAGAAAGQSLGDLDRFGIDVVMVAFFGSLVFADLRKREHILPVMVAAGVTLVTIDLLPAGWNIIAAALTGGVVGAMRFGR